MIKKKIKKKDNVINFPAKLSSLEKEIEAVVFAAAEPFLSFEGFVVTAVFNLEPGLAFL